MISVCMATFNGERFIKQQLDSILSQLSPEDEVIISDDGSTDNTLEIIKAYNDSRIKILIHQKTNFFENVKEGRNFYFVTSNFENALKQASGDIIILSDQDDIWMPDKVEKTLELHKSHDLVVHNYQVIDENNNVIKEKMFSENPIHKLWIMNIMDSHFRGCCMSFKASYLKQILPIPQNIIGHDYWIGGIIFKLGNVFYNEKPYVQYRSYSTSVSAKKKNSISYKINYRYNLYKELKKRLREIKE